MWSKAFNGLDAILRVVEPHFPQRSRQRAIKAAVAFVKDG